MLETEQTLVDIAVGIRMLELIRVPVKPPWRQQVKDMLMCNPCFHPGHVTQHVCKTSIGFPPLQHHNWAAVTSARKRLICPRGWPARRGQGQPRSVVISNIPSVNPKLILGMYRGAMCPFRQVCCGSGRQNTWRKQTPDLKGSSTSSLSML